MRRSDSELPTNDNQHEDNEIGAWPRQEGARHGPTELRHWGERRFIEQVLSPRDAPCWHLRLPSFGEEM
jgi:hypothetical protein